jgi:hypothetical protein
MPHVDVDVTGHRLCLDGVPVRLASRRRLDFFLAIRRLQPPGTWVVRDALFADVARRSGEPELAREKRPRAVERVRGALCAHGVTILTEELPQGEEGPREHDVGRRIAHAAFHQDAGWRCDGEGFAVHPATLDLHVPHRHGYVRSFRMTPRQGTLIRALSDSEGLPVSRATLGALIGSEPAHAVHVPLNVLGRRLRRHGCADPLQPQLCGRWGVRLPQPWALMPNPFAPGAVPPRPVLHGVEDVRWDRAAWVRRRVLTPVGGSIADRARRLTSTGGTTAVVRAAQAVVQGGTLIGGDGPARRTIVGTEPPVTVEVRRQPGRVELAAAWETRYWAVRLDVIVADQAGFQQGLADAVGPVLDAASVAHGLHALGNGIGRRVLVTGSTEAAVLALP